jgi:hypothetical protein
MMRKTMNTDLLIQEYLDLVIKATNQHYEKHYPRMDPPRFYIMKGRKRHRVVETDVKQGYRRVHAFVGEDGMLYKAASWAAAAKDARYNLASDMEEIRSRFDPNGSYLYHR